MKKLSCILVSVLLIAALTACSSPDPKPDIGIDVTFSSSFKNDTTGRWRLAKIAENVDITDYAIDYYESYFESDDEVHVIINSTLNTTTCVNKFGDELYLTITEYVNGEENDASLACSGLYLGEYTVNVNTGDVEKL